MIRRVWVLTLTVLALSLVVIVHAAEPASISLTVSGGVSYGSYQAGYHYVANDWLRVNRNECRVRVVTGASAGAINALLIVLALADTGFVQDTQCIFYRTWMPISFERLNCGTTALGVLNRHYFDELCESVILPQFNTPPFGDSLDVVLGLTGTRTIATQFELAKGLSVPTCEEKFVVRMTRPAGRSWLFRNYLDPDSRLPAAVLPLRQNNPPESRLQDCKVLSRIAYASSGFPGAFEPLSLKLREIVPAQTHNLHWDTAAIPLWTEMRSASPLDVPGDSSQPKFIDGGVFDNAPLRLAADLACNGLVEDRGGVHWASLPHWKERNPIVDSMLFVYISQNNTLFPQSRRPQRETDVSLISTLLSVSGNILNSAHSKELRAIVERFPQFRPYLTGSYAPSMSGYLVDFLGFFERPFRVFDFYLGMYDASRYIRDFAGPGLGARGHVVTADVPSTSDAHSDIRFQITKRILDLVYRTVDSCHSDPSFKPDGGYWAPRVASINDWFSSIYDSASTVGPGATQHDLMQHVIMLQSSIDRLWGRWLSSQVMVDCWEVDSSQATAWLRMKGFRPTFFSLHPVNANEFHKRVLLPDSLQAIGKALSATEYDAMLFLLEHYGYIYENIFKGKRASAAVANREISHLFTKLIRSLADKQRSLVERNSFRLAAKPTMNFFAYSPPNLAIRLGGGSDGLHAGLSVPLFPGVPVIERVRPDIYLTLGKGSKANIGVARHRQLFPPFAVSPGVLLDLGHNAWWQFKYGGSVGFGKDWMINSTSASERGRSWTLEFTPVIVQLSLLDVVFVRAYFGGQRPVDFVDGSWGAMDWTRLGAQVGIQFIR
jgi:predicted acylesterase/phospholipase RssA